MNVDLWRTCLRGAMHLHPYARLVAYTLAEAVGPDGLIADSDQPEHESLCLATALDVGLLLQAIEELAVTGWISRSNDGINPTRYQLRLPAQAPAERNR